MTYAEAALNVLALEDIASDLGRQFGIADAAARRKRTPGRGWARLAAERALNDALANLTAARELADELHAAERRAERAARIAANPQQELF